jgi:hypothetical protein
MRALTYCDLITEDGTASDEHDETVTAVTHVREDSIRDVYDTEKVDSHHVHHCLGPANQLCYFLRQLIELTD